MLHFRRLKRNNGSAQVEPSEANSVDQYLDACFASRRPGVYRSPATAVPTTPQAYSSEAGDPSSRSRATI